MRVTRRNFMQLTLAITPRKKRISLTALIDVVFILLLFFMLTSSFSSLHTSQLALPAKGDTSNTNNTYPVLLTITKSGDLLTHKGEIIAPSQINAHLQAFDDFNGQLIITPTPQCTLQTMLSAIDTINALGISQVNLGPVTKAVNNAS